MRVVGSRHVTDHSDVGREDGAGLRPVDGERGDLFRRTVKVGRSMDAATPRRRRGTAAFRRWPRRVGLIHPNPRRRVRPILVTGGIHAPALRRSSGRRRRPRYAPTEADASGHRPVPLDRRPDLFCGSVSTIVLTGAIGRRARTRTSPGPTVGGVRPARPSRGGAVSAYGRSPSRPRRAAAQAGHAARRAQVRGRRSDGQVPPRGSSTGRPSRGPDRANWTHEELGRRPGSRPTARPRTSRARAVHAGSAASDRHPAVPTVRTAILRGTPDKQAQAEEDLAALRPHTARRLLRRVPRAERPPCRSRPVGIARAGRTRQPTVRRLRPSA